MKEVEVATKTDEAVYSPTRATSRFVPLQTVNAVLLTDNGFLSHGVLSNISERGACLITNTMIEPDQRIRIKFTTQRRAELFQAPARVVWSSEGMDRQLEIVGVMVGVTFQDLSDSERKWIGEILEQDNFIRVEPPDEPREAASGGTPPANPQFS